MELTEILKELEELAPEGFYERDLTALDLGEGKRTAAIFAVADGLRALREKNYATVLFRSGLALWEGPEETGFAAFAAGAAMLGLQAAQVETLDQTALVALPDVICPRGDVSLLCDELYRQGLLSQRPLSLPRDTALPLVLELLHASGGAREMRERQVPALANAPADLPALLAAFGLEQGTEELEPAERLRVESLRPYVVAGMILLGKCPQPVATLRELQRMGQARRLV